MGGYRHVIVENDRNKTGGAMLGEVDEKRKINLFGDLRIIGLWL